MGRVTEVFTPDIIACLKGNMALGHTRYSTNGSSVKRLAQPFIYPGREGNVIALAHNGNIPYLHQLEEALEGTSYSTDGLNDSQMIAAHISYLTHVKGADLEDAVYETYPLLESGGFAIAVATPNKLIAFRDGHGLRPLSVGRLEEGYIFASETCAIDEVHGALLSNVETGELVIIEDGIMSSPRLELGPRRPEALCLFEYVYFMSTDSKIKGRPAASYREDLRVDLA